MANVRLVIALSVGICGGIVVSNSIHAQSKPPAYYITQVQAVDQEAFTKNYSSQVEATLAPYGGRFIVRGASAIKLDGDPKPRIAVVRFESLDRAQAWFNSPEYQKLFAAKKDLATSDTVLVEGVPD